MGLGQVQQGLVIGVRSFARLLVGEVVTPYPAVQPLESVEDQGIDGIAGGKRQLVMETIVELGIGLGRVLHFGGAAQDLGGLLRVVTDGTTNEDGADVGACRQQLGDQIRHLVLIQTGQGLQNIETGGFPEVVYLGRFAMLYGQPAVTGQTLQHFPQGCACHPDQLGQFTLCRQNGSGRKAIVPDGLDDVFLGKPCRALRFYDHEMTLL